MFLLEEPVTLKVNHVTDFAARCPEQYQAITECAAFVNWRLLKAGHEPVLTLAFYKADLPKAGRETSLIQRLVNPLGRWRAYW